MKDVLVVNGHRRHEAEAGIFYDGGVALRLDVIAVLKVTQDANA